mgnify:CR=1 FL=1
MEIQLCAEMEEDRTKSHRGTVHEDEFARRRDRAEFTQALVNRECLPASIFAGLDAVRDRAHAIIEKRRIDEARPKIQRVDQFIRQIAKTPALIRRRRPVAVIGFERVIKLGGKIRMQP